MIKLNLDDLLPTCSWKIKVALDDRRKGEDQIFFFLESVHSFKKNAQRRSLDRKGFEEKRYG